MATWTRNFTGTMPSATGTALSGAVSLDNATAPPDFDPAAVLSVRYVIPIQGSGFNDDTWIDHRSARLQTPSLVSVTAEVDLSDVSGLGNTTQTLDTTVSSGISTVLSVATWESFQLGPATGSGIWATYSQNMGPDGGTIAILSSGFVVIDYDPLSVGQEVNVGTLGESGTLVGVEADKPISASVGVVAEASSLNPATVASPVVAQVGQLSETNLLPPVEAVKPLATAVGTRGEINALQAAQGMKPIHEQVGSLPTDDTLVAAPPLQPISAGVGTVTEDDMNVAVPGIRGVQVGVVGEDNVLGGTSPLRVVAVGNIAELNATNTIVVVGQSMIVVGTIGQVDSLGEIQADKLIVEPVGVIGEAGALVVVEAVKPVVVNVGTIFGPEALVETSGAKFAVVATVAESNILRGVAVQLGADQSIDLGVMGEAGSLVSIQAAKPVIYQITTIAETGMLALIEPAIGISVNTLSEVNALVEVEAQKPQILTLGTVGEVGVLYPVAGLKGRDVGILAGFEALGPVRGDKSFPIYTMVETNTLLGVQAIKPIIIPIGLIQEIETLRTIMAILGEPIILYMRVSSIGNRTSVVSRENRTNVSSGEYDAEQEAVVEGTV